MIVLAVDFGTRRLGLALGNTSLRTATPLPPLHRGELAHDVDRFHEVKEEYGVECLLFGRPLNMDGTPGRIMAAAENFANHLRRQLNLPLLWQDERLSSVAADELLAPNEPDPFKRKAMRDSVAAMVFLNDFLESQ